MIKEEGAEDIARKGLNEVRPGRPEQFDAAGITGRVVWGGLNEVRPGRPEQSQQASAIAAEARVSMKSGLEDRNNGSPRKAALTRDFTSTCELSAPPGPIKPLC